MEAINVVEFVTNVILILNVFHIISCFVTDVWEIFKGVRVFKMNLDIGVITAESQQ